MTKVFEVVMTITVLDEEAVMNAAAEASKVLATRSIEDCLSHLIDVKVNVDESDGEVYIIDSFSVADVTDDCGEDME